ncbi:VIT domain-containing protein [Streptomyces polyrhachis]|uniref:VIT domain-containing protein n=1 Tax=Streptomyces polyrhachis TaxID=1282885 RepID=A0ABW2GEN0_9ACTN
MNAATTPVITPLAPGEGAPLPDAGLGALRTERGNLPLESVAVAARIAGMSAGVEVVQGFRNPFDVSLEATYVFPLPDRAAVTAFRLEAEDRVVEGVLKERGEARADYDRALAQGRRAAIAEEERPDVFTIRVGNLAPGERVRVRLTLSQPLPYEDGAAEFRFPLVVAPRYVPGSPLAVDPAGSGTAPDTDAVPDASRITPPVLLPGFPDPVRLSLEVRVDPAGLSLRELRSSLHEVTTVQADGSPESGAVLVRLRPGERLDRDFVLRLAFDASDSLALVADTEAPEGADGARESGEGGGEGGTFALTVVPEPGEAVRRPRDVVLVLDRSGSMSGWKMVAARRAAARIVDTLTVRDRFTVLSFDHRVERPERLPEGLAEAGDRNRYRAVEHLARLEARGGTELLGPLRQALDLLLGREEAPRETAERDRVLVLVTDGQVGNEDQILEQTGADLSRVRVHTVGIDRAVNAGFLGRLAALGGGRCELVESEDRLDEAMEQIHRRIGAPLVTGLSLRAEGLELLDGTVTHTGSLFSGVPLRILGRYRRAGGGDPVVTLRGTTGDGEPWERAVRGTARSDRATAPLWARSRLRTLEDRYTMGERSLEEDIVATSLRFTVLCRFTAFVAVDSRVAAEGGPQHRVVQPVESPSGWAAPAAAPAMPAAAYAMPLSAPRSMAPPAGGMGRRGAPGSAAAAQSAPGGVPAPPPMGSGAPGAGSMGGAPLPTWSEIAHGGARARRAPRPEQAAGRSGPDLQPLLQAELTRLEAAVSAAPAERRRLLSDLGTRLAALLDPADGTYAHLAELARELTAAESPAADLPSLWKRTVDLLISLLADTGPAPADGGAPREEGASRPFWKRG